MFFNKANSQIVPTLIPIGGFHIDGGLEANTQSNGIGDWTSGIGTGESVLNADGTPIYVDKTKIIIDDYNSKSDLIFQGSKFNDNPNTWSWTTGKASSKNDINNAIFHLDNDDSNNTWLMVGGDRLSTTGSSYIDFEFLQNTVTRNDDGGFNSAGPDGGRTVNDMVLSMEYSNGGTNANVHFYLWQSVGTGYQYVEYSFSPSVAFALTNAVSENISFSAFGNPDYAPYQFVEAAINVSEIFGNVDPCIGISVNKVIVKTKASDSETAALGDFVEPVQVQFNFGTAEISYNEILYNDGFEDVSLTGVTGGNFFASPIGLTINQLTGEIDLSNSIPGDYTITYSFITNSCPKSVTTNIKIKERRSADPIIGSPKSAINDIDRLYISTEDYTPEELVNDIFLTGCVSASNIVYTGSSESIGYFSDNSGNFNFSSGIVLSSGNATDVNGPNDNDNETTNLGTNGDSDLDIISGYTTYDASVLEFDFVPSSAIIEFRYTFGSEEYPEYACSKFNDVFAFLVSGAGISGGEGYTNDAVNIALLPSSTTPVAINNIHNDISAATDVTGDGCSAINVSYYIDNGTGSTPGSEVLQFDGYTVTLVARIEVQACQTYHIKLVVADASDRILDSGVLLEANSFKSESVITLNNTPAGPDNNVFENCNNTYTISRADSSFINDNITINLSYSGDAIIGTDITNLPTSLIIPAGSMSTSFSYDAIQDNLNEGIENLIISVYSTCQCDQGIVSFTDTIFINDGLEAQGLNLSDIVCYGDNNGSIEVSTQNNNGVVQYSIDDNPYQLSNQFTDLSQGNYLITIVDESQCPISLTDNLISEPNELSASIVGSSQVSCYNAEDGEIVVTATGGTGVLSYSLNGGLAQSSNLFSGLVSGIYEVVVSDENNCSVTIEAITIANPSMLEASAEGSSQVSCYNAEDGIVTVTANGGTGVLSYSLNSGLAQSSNLFSGLTAGEYSVVVTDENNCSVTTAAITIANPSMLEASE